MNEMSSEFYKISHTNKLVSNQINQIMFQSYDNYKICTKLFNPIPTGGALLGPNDLKQSGISQFYG